ncbi:L-threonylcarbamoyladenylate synthase [Selenomonas sputigena]|uniref:Threonylcarbamoyl-AMP synthase n=1 Tax=Selenomonas sputigena TaxID=69823 RepID=A0ABV3X6M7_9FIRM
MQTKILQPTAAALAEAAAILRSGGLVAFPTETVYGLGANGLDAAACAGIYEAKGRPSDNPLILHIADRAMLDAVALDVPDAAEKLLAAFCPGPLTLILRCSDAVPARVTGGLATVGVRMPGNDTALALIRAAGVPLAAPSANISGRPSPTTAEAVLSDLAGRIPLILDGGACRFGVESTIVDVTGAAATILRPGAITREMLAEVLGEVRLDGGLLAQERAAQARNGAAGSGAPGHAAMEAAAGEAPRAPGMKYTHYAPRAPLTLLQAPPEELPAAFCAALAEAKGRDVGLIVTDETAAALADKIPESRMARLGPRGDMRTVAARLYEALRSFDEKPVDMLFGEAFDESGLGLAVMNRLKKAAGYRIRRCGK